MIMVGFEPMTLGLEAQLACHSATEADWPLDLRLCLYSLLA